MKCLGTGPAVGAAVAILWIAAVGELLAEKENPYRSILSRNAFGLQDEPPPRAAEPPPPPPKPAATVRLAGITTMFSKARALFEVVPEPGKPPEKPIMLVGEKVGDIELVSIDVENNQVTILNAGVKTNLVLEARKAPPPPPARLAPGIRPGLPRPGVKMPTPRHGTAATPSPTVITPGSGGSRGGGGIVVVGGSGADTASVASPAVSAVPPMPTAGNRLVGRLPSSRSSISTLSPASPLRPSPTVPPRTTRAQTAAPAVPQDPAAQYALMLLNEERSRQEGEPTPPLPPIPQDEFPVSE